MNQKIIIAISIFGIILLSQVAFASVSTVSTSMSTSRATTGTSVTSTVTVTATGSESGSVQLVCTPSGVTISDPSSGSYQGVSLSSSPTSKTFTMSAGTANTYTCQGQSGGVTGDATIVFVDPSSLTVTGTPSSKSGAKTSTFSLTVNIQNSQSNAITTSYSLSCGSHTCSGDSTSSTVTVAAGTTTALTWTVTIGGTSSASTITFALGDNSNAFSTSVTCTDCVTTTTTTDTTTTTGGTTPAAKKITTQKGKATITIPTIAAGKSETVDIVKTEDVAIRKIVVSVANKVNNIQITVGKLPDKPATITQEITGKVYHYMEINKTNITDSDVNQTIIRFEVEKSWITTNSVNKSEVALFRYSSNAWNKLQTTELSDDGTNVLYEAVSPGLSVFAIGLGEAPAAPTQPTGETPTGEKTPEEVVEEVKKDSWKIAIIIVVFVASVAGFVLMKKNVFNIQKKKSSWDELKRKYSRNRI